MNKNNTCISICLETKCNIHKSDEEKRRYLQLFYIKFAIYKSTFEIKKNLKIRLRVCTHDKSETFITWSKELITYSQSTQNKVVSDTSKAEVV